MQLAKTTCGLAAALLSASTLGFASLAYADNYPERPVELIVPFPPGGVVDLAGRAIGTPLGNVWDETIVILNRGGAGGGVGMGAAARANADGYTLLAAHSSIISLPESEKLFDRETPYNLDSFEPIALLMADPTILVVHTDSPWQTYEEFIADARERPDDLTYASSGAYSALHLPIEMLAGAADIELRHIPFSGGGPAIAAVLSGTVDATVGSPGTVGAHIRAGTLRPLVSTGAERSPVLPDVPTAQELGYDVESYLWVGMFAPAGTPENRIDNIRAAVKEAAADPRYVNAIETVGSRVDYRDAPEFRQFLQEDAERISDAIQRIGKIE